MCSETSGYLRQDRLMQGTAVSRTLGLNLRLIFDVAINVKTDRESEPLSIVMQRVVNLIFVRVVSPCVHLTETEQFIRRKTLDANI